VPQVASQTISHASSATHGHTYRPPAQQSERTSGSPFQSMLDDNAAAADDRPSEDGSKVARGQDTSKPAKADASNATSADKPQDAKAANVAKPDQADQTGKADKAIKADKADKAGKAIKADTAETTDKTADGDKDAAKDPSKAAADAAATAQVGDATKPANGTADPTAAAAVPVPPTPPVDPAATNILASTLIPAGTGHATAVQTTAADEQPVEAAAVTADAAKSAPVTVAAFQVQTAKAGESGKSNKPGAQDAAKGPDKIDATSGDDDAQADKAGAQAKADAKAAQPPLTEADKQHIARARGETSTDGKQAAAKDAPAVNHADANTAAAKADGVTPQIQIATAHTAAAAPSAPAPEQPTPQAAAVPLAGLGVEIASKALDGTNHFEIRLDPPELGRIEVRLNVDKDGHVTSRLIADRSDTLDLLRRDSAGLERALQDAGLKTSDNGMQFSLRDQSGGQQQQQQQSANRSTLVVQDDTLPAIDATQIPYGRYGTRAGGLDIRV